MVNIKYKDLDGYLNSKIKKAVLECGKIAELELKKNLIDNWYKANGSPADYERTYELLHSITIKPTLIKGYISCEIFFDDYKIEARESTNKGGWNIHMSSDFKDVSNMIAEWIENDVNGGLFPHSGAYMVRDTYNYMLRNYKMLLKRELKKQGLNVK